MRERIGLAIAGLLAAMSLIGAQAASAATEVGENCGADGAFGSVTQLQFADAPGSPLPLTIPSAGIVTKWSVNVKVPIPDLPQQLRIFRATGAKTFQTIAESSVENVKSGSNSFATRFPVQAGDRIGVYAGPSSATLYCTTGNPADVLGYFPGNASVGSSNEYTEAPGLKSAVSATIEPDADNDGYGDETQDKCPRSAALQNVECPVITLGAFGRQKKGSALILVSASSQAPVTVFGTVKVPKKKGKKGKRQITLQGGTQSVSPGAVAPFSLIFPPVLKSALAKMPRSKSLPLRVTATTTDLAGQPSSTQLTLKLKGQKKNKKGKGKAKAKG